MNKFIDSNVVLGQTYYYAVCSYDEGDASQDIFPTENPKFIRRSSTGEIITDDNTAFITPGFRPAGYEKAKFIDFTKSPGFIGTGKIDIEIVDDKAINDRFKYEIVFEDSGISSNTTNWTLIDLQTPDTIQ